MTRAFALSCVLLTVFFCTSSLAASRNAASGAAVPLFQGQRSLGSQNGAGAETAGGQAGGLRGISMQDAVNQAQEDYFIAREKYRAGEGLMLDIIDAQLALSTAQLNYISAQYDYARYKATVENAMGLGIGETADTASAAAANATATAAAAAEPAAPAAVKPAAEVQTAQQPTTAQLPAADETAEAGETAEAAAENGVTE